MNRIIFILASIIAAVTFASEASALPLFARQTGMECAACHFQHFPMLNSFGRAFKAGGFTMMGAQAKVEGDHLSIPAELNMALLTTAGYVKTNATPFTGGTGATGRLNNDGNGTIFVPGTNGELSLFMGGRVSEDAGFLSELGMVGSPAGLASAKLPILFEVGDSGTRVGVVPFTTASAGASYGYETLNTGANGVHTMLFVAGDANGSIAGALSAQQYLGTNGNATGAAIVANNSMGFINITRFHMVGPADLRAPGNVAAVGGSQTGGGLGSTYLRVAGTMDVGNWDAGAGIQSWRGSSYNAAPGGVVLNAGLYDTKATAIDGQMQGAVGTMPVGFYVSYARAPATTNVNSLVPTASNVYNAGLQTKSSFNISTEWGVVPEKATVGMAIRRGKSGTNAGSLVAGANDTDNAVLLDGSYKVAQNMVLSLVYVSQSGSYWSTANKNATGNKQTTISLATIF
jgi:hypothetical protein